jgi:hypothetical protein
MISTAAIASDNLAETIDYASLAQALLRFGEGCHWALIETLAADIAVMVLDDFRPASVTVEVKKFVIPQRATWPSRSRARTRITARARPTGDRPFCYASFRPPGIGPALTARGRCGTLRPRPFHETRWHDPSRFGSPHRHRLPRGHEPFHR